MTTATAPPRLTAITPREASAFACVCDTVVAPADDLPAVADTDAAFAFDRTLAASPALNRIGLRAMLAVCELAPLLTHGRRLRRLSPPQRAEALDAIERTTAGAGVVKAVRGIAHLSYYGDDDVARRIGYDADAVVARGAAVRAEEARW